MTRQEVIEALVQDYREQVESNNSVSTGQAAKLLHASEATIKRWADAGKLRVSRGVGGHRHLDISQGLPDDLKVKRSDDDARV